MSKLSRAAKASVLAACAATTLGIQPSSALEYNFGDVQVFLDTDAVGRRSNAGR